MKYISEMILMLEWNADLQVKKGIEAVEATNSDRNGWEAVGTLRAWKDDGFKTEAMMAFAEGKLFKPNPLSASLLSDMVGE